MRTIVHSAEETHVVAANLAHSLLGGECISLIGDLGAGKTTFAQGLVAALGSPARVKSPTFTVMNEYAVPGHATIRRVIHCDFYRFTSMHDLGALELQEYRRPDTVILVEWPNILADMPWQPDITVTIMHGTGEEAQERTIDITDIVQP